MKFECQNVFMIRTPELSFEYLLEYYQQDRDVYEFIKNNEILDNFFRKALLISSKSLYRSYINRPTNVKQYDNLIKSLYKYFIRSTTRTTPFGYYASVALGEFATTTCLVKGRSIVDIKIDNEWINSIIYQIENENENLSKLQFSFNKICYKSGDRFKNPCFTNYGKQADNGQEIVNEVSIKWSPLIELIKEKSTNFVSYKELKKYIALYYPTVSEKKIDTTLKTLVENEFLLSELRIPAYCSDTLKHVIDVLNSTNICSEKVKKLNVIYDKIVLFKKSQQIECLEEIVSELEFIYNIPNVLLLNLGNNYISKTLQYDIKERIENFANTLSYLPLEYDFLKKFKNKFIAKYGLNVEVPLLNIIDENDFNGLSYLEEPGVKNSNYHQEIHTVIESKIMEAIINNQEEVCLCKTDFKNIPSFHYKKSFDLNVLITKVDNDYKLYVGPNKCSCKAGNMFQRFSDCFERCDMEKYNNIYEKEE